MLRVLLTNDDGIHAEGLQALRRALLDIPDVWLEVIAPDANRSATARSITTRRPLAVDEIAFDDGTVGYATDGTPVDCVRCAWLGVVEGFRPELVVSGINHGSNIGDDISYSGTVAAAFEAVVLGLPGIAVSQQSIARELDFRLADHYDFSRSAAFAARMVEELGSVPLRAGTLLNVNVPGGVPADVALCRIGKRIYGDELVLERSEASGRRHYRVYGTSPGFEDEPGTDVAAVAAGRIAVTPIHFDLTDHRGLEALAEYDLGRLLGSAPAPPA